HQPPEGWVCESHSVVEKQDKNYDGMAHRKEAILRNRTIMTSAALALVIALTGVGNVGSASGAIFKAQEAKPAQSTDKRADALKKYLEAQRLDQAGNYPGAVAAYKEALALDP